MASKQAEFPKSFDVSNLSESKDLTSNIESINFKCKKRTDDLKYQLMYKMLDSNEKNQQKSDRNKDVDIPDNIFYSKCKGMQGSNSAMIPGLYNLKEKDINRDKFYLSDIREEELNMEKYKSLLQQNKDFICSNTKNHLPRYFTETLGNNNEKGLPLTSNAELAFSNSRNTFYDGLCKSKNDINFDQPVDNIYESSKFKFPMNKARKNSKSMDLSHQKIGLTVDLKKQLQNKFSANYNFKIEPGYTKKISTVKKSENTLKNISKYYDLKKINGQDVINDFKTKIFKNGEKIDINYKLGTNNRKLISNLKSRNNLKSRSKRLNMPSDHNNQMSHDIFNIEMSINQSANIEKVISAKNIPHDTNLSKEVKRNFSEKNLTNWNQKKSTVLLPKKEDIETSIRIPGYKNVNIGKVQIKNDNIIMKSDIYMKESIFKPKMIENKWGKSNKLPISYMEKNIELTAFTQVSPFNHENTYETINTENSICNEKSKLNTKMFLNKNNFMKPKRHKLFGDNSTKNIDNKMCKQIQFTESVRKNSLNNNAFNIDFGVDTDFTRTQLEELVTRKRNENKWLEYRDYTEKQTDVKIPKKLCGI